MRYTILLSVLTLLALASSTHAGDQKNLPASATTAAERLKASPRHGEWVEVPMGDLKIKSYVVYPEVKDKAPVVLVIHEIFGMTEWVQSVADQLAAEGFIAVAPDFLSGMGPNGGGTDSLGDNVRPTIGKVTPDEQVKRLNAVREWAIAQPSATDKVASIGFCWGGSASFNYAANQPKLSAAVVYYGTAPKDAAQIAKIPCPVLGCYGGNDNRVTSTVEPTKTAMADAKKQYEPHVYEGAGHGFLRQQDGQNGANLKATQEAWATTIDFLKKNLK